jgi:hypothetical protein
MKYIKRFIGESIDFNGQGGDYLEVIRLLTSGDDFDKYLGETEIESYSQEELEEFKIYFVKEINGQFKPPVSGIYRMLSLIERLGVTDLITNPDFKPVSVIRELTGKSYNELLNSETIYLNFEEDTVLPDGCFRGLPNLREIIAEVSWSKKLKVDVEFNDNSFEGTTGLERIVLQKVYLKKVTGSPFKNLDRFKVLKTYNYSPLEGYDARTEFSKEAFSGCDSLESLEISLKNNFPVTIFKGLYSLKHLEIKYTRNHFTSATFSSLSNLLILHLGDAVFTYWPGAFIPLESLKKLYINLDSIPKETVEKIRSELPEGCKIENWLPF